MAGEMQRPLAVIARAEIPLLTCLDADLGSRFHQGSRFKLCRGHTAWGAGVRWLFRTELSGPVPLANLADSSFSAFLMRCLS